MPNAHCKCPHPPHGSPDTRLDHWEVMAYHCSYPLGFHGRYSGPSSIVRCTVCNQSWRTTAKYADVIWRRDHK